MLNTQECRIRSHRPGPKEACDLMKIEKLAKDIIHCIHGKTVMFSVWGIKRMFGEEALRQLPEKVT